MTTRAAAAATGVRCCRSFVRTGAVLVYVGRGGVVDQQALLQAFAGGRLTGVVLDVLSIEPRLETAHSGSSERPGQCAHSRLVGP